MSIHWTFISRHRKVFDQNNSFDVFFQKESSPSKIKMTFYSCDRYDLTGSGFTIGRPSKISQRCSISSDSNLLVDWAYPTLYGSSSLSEGCEFESWHRILDGHLLTLICCKICIVCFKKTENKWKRGREWPFFNIKPHF